MPLLPNNFLILLFLFFIFFKIEGRYPCLNDGEPILLGQNSNEFRCECQTGFFGPFCEYQDTSQSIKEKPSIPTSTSLFSPNNITSNQQRGWETTFVNLLICVFFLLLLPSLNNRPTPPPHYWASMRYQENIHCNNSQQQSLTWLLPLNNREEQRGQLLQQQQRMRRRRRSVSPITEVTVQLPSSIYRSRPIHNTRSAGCPQQLHQSQSLTLAEFHELLLRIQREMQTRQHLEGLEQQHQLESEQQNTAVGTIIGQQNYHNDPLFSPTLSALPIEPPPSYNELMNH